MRKAYKDYYKGYKNVDDYRVHNLYERGDLRYRLAQAFPYEKSTEPLTRKIWQLWKTKVFEELDAGLQNLVSTFKSQEDMDKGLYNYTLFANSEQSAMVKRMFAAVPEIHQAYDALPKVILQADFMRYLVVFAEGGMYSDIDTSLETELQNWITYNETLYDMPNQVGCVVGAEEDVDDLSWNPSLMPRRLQFCQWTIQAKSGHPIYRDLVARITELTLNHYNNETKDLRVGSKTYNMNDDSPTRNDGILEWTGPALYTDVIFNYMSEVYRYSEEIFGVDFYNSKMVDPNRQFNLQEKIQYPVIEGYDQNEYDPVTFPLGWQNFTKQIHPILIDDDLLVLPRRFLASRERHPDEYVRHHFKGSWKGQR
jgi:alpha 1,6-mannosyltransferase